MPCQPNGDIDYHGMDDICGELVVRMGADLTPTKARAHRIAVNLHGKHVGATDCMRGRHWLKGSGYPDKEDRARDVSPCPHHAVKQPDHIALSDAETEPNGAGEVHERLPCPSPNGALLRVVEQGEVVEANAVAKLPEDDADSERESGQAMLEHEQEEETLLRNPAQHWPAEERAERANEHGEPETGQPQDDWSNSRRESTANGAASRCEADTARAMDAGEAAGSALATRPRGAAADASWCGCAGSETSASARGGHTSGAASSFHAYGDLKDSFDDLKDVFGADGLPRTPSRAKAVPCCGRQGSSEDEQQDEKQCLAASRRGRALEEEQAHKDGLQVLDFLLMPLRDALFGPQGILSDDGSKTQTNQKDLVSFDRHLDVDLGVEPGATRLEALEPLSSPLISRRPSYTPTRAPGLTPNTPAPELPPRSPGLADGLGTRPLTKQGLDGLGAVSQGGVEWHF